MRESRNVPDYQKDTHTFSSLSILLMFHHQQQTNNNRMLCYDACEPLDLEEIPQISWVERAVRAYVPAADVGKHDVQEDLESVDKYETDRYSFKRKKCTRRFTRSSMQKNKDKKSTNRTLAKPNNEVNRVTHPLVSPIDDKYQVCGENSSCLYRMQRDRSAPTYAGWSFSSGAYPVVRDLVPLGLFDVHSQDDPTQEDDAPPSSLHDLPKLLHIRESDVSELTMPHALLGSDFSMVPISTSIAFVNSTISTMTMAQPKRTTPVDSLDDNSFTCFTTESCSSDSEVTFVIYDKSANGDPLCRVPRTARNTLVAMEQEQVKRSAPSTRRLSRRLKRLFSKISRRSKNAGCQEGVILDTPPEEIPPYEDVVSVKVLTFKANNKNTNVRETVAIEQNVKRSKMRQTSRRKLPRKKRKRKKKGGNQDAGDSEFNGGVIEGNTADRVSSLSGSRSKNKRNRFTKLLPSRIKRSIRKDYHQEGQVVDSELDDTDSDMTQTHIVVDESPIVENRSSRFQFFLKAKAGLVARIFKFKECVQEEEELPWEFVDADEETVQLLGI